MSDESTKRDAIDARASRRRAAEQEAREAGRLALDAQVEAIMARVQANPRHDVDDEPPAELTAEARVEQRWRALAPERFAHASLEQLTELPEVAFGQLAGWCEQVVSGTAGNLLLLGPVGVGKTFTGFAVCRHLLEAGRRVCWWPTVELLDGLRPDGGVDVEQPSTVDVLFLDDLGGEKPSEWVSERLYLVVNRRWLDGRPTIVTSNLGRDDLVEVVGERTWDRLRDGSVAVKLSGESRRAGAKAS